MILPNTFKTYSDLDDFILEDDNWKLFIDVYGYSPSSTNIKRKLKTNKNWTSDLDILIRLLENKEGVYIAGEFNSSYEYWTGECYAMSGEYVMWVHEIKKEKEEI
jgi:hypothetical protein